MGLPTCLETIMPSRRGQPVTRAGYQRLVLNSKSTIK